MFQCISMCLNVFIDIVIEFHHHILIVTFFPCRFFFTLYNDSLPNMLYHYILFFPFLLIHSNFHTIYPYFFMFIHHPTFHIPHSMLSVVARSIAEPKYKYFIHTILFQFYIIYVFNHYSLQ
jgi:hypothetical protein